MSPRREVQALFTHNNQCGSHGETLLNTIFKSLVPNALPITDPALKKDAVECAMECRRTARAVFLTFRPQYMHMLQDVVPCIQNGID